MRTSINTNLLAANAAGNLASHYAKLACSTKKLSSGLRINSAADDAAGLAIRELMRADVSAMHQGMRNANDAISLIQTADAALGIIDEKLIRMKELAEQAATGTYDSTQRLMINSEFQAMASEIDRIANATDFNGIHLLNGSLSGEHDGSGLNSVGKMKIHFGSGNDSAEDYYYIDIGDCTIRGLGLGSAENAIFVNGEAQISNYDLYIGEWGSNNAVASIKDQGHSLISVLGSPTPNSDCHIIYMTNDLLPSPAYTNASSNEYSMDQPGLETLQWQIFSKNGIHYAGTRENAQDSLWQTVLKDNGFATIQDWMDASGLFDAGAQYELPAAVVDFASPEIDNGLIYYEHTTMCNALYFNDFNQPTLGGVTLAPDDLIIVALTVPTPLTVISPDGEVVANDPFPTIDTQDKAQQMLPRIDEAIVKKDKIRAHLGALQNRLENTVSNLNIQAENLQAAESQISDVDIATEMTNFVRNQILTQSAVAMLGHANSMPQMCMQLIQG